MSHIVRVRPLGFPWETADPFLFCVHHDDAYPAANAQLGPAVTLDGRDLGQDFSRKDGWSMYHGRVVPGFPQHPHRGFETVTVARRGFIDHSDSMGATARYGQGDVQWLTAGGGIEHAEMFPLVHTDQPNPVELFQIWLNLPAKHKMAPPHFSMFWADDVPVVEHADERGRKTIINVVAGRVQERQAPAPPPHSWASQQDTDVAIWTIKMEPGATFTLPAANPGTRRTIYFFAGPALELADKGFDRHAGVEVKGDAPTPLVARDGEVELLVLQGRPIDEPVVQYGPFVMNTSQEIQQAFVDYQRTRFGGWPWPSADPNHGRTAGRFARHADGKREEAKKSR
jgi:redox-sensitive bicupin YhaK (pirin superfamily)